ncbi:hypothetical protein DVH05_019357 [Phytophthora capsici]|nr:hypothetical protein DVH05_019357 [Phytophthora capsici]
MDRSSSWTNAGRNADYIPPSRVAKMATSSPRPPPGSTAEAVATARRAEYGTGGSILPVLPTASPSGYKRSSWTTPRSPSSNTLEDEAQQPNSDSVTASPRRAEMAAAKRAEPVRQRFVSDGLFASETEQAQLQYMEQMYGTINLLNAELENERRNRAALEAAARPATYSSTTEYSSLEDAVGEFDEPSGYLVSHTPVTPSYTPRKLRTVPSPPSQPPQTQYRVARPPVSPRSVVKDQDQELCATLGKNAELRIRSRDMERTVEKTELELELARKQIKMAERRAESREEKLRALLKEKLSWQKELKDIRAQVVEEKMRQVDLFREVEAAKRHFAAELEAAEQELQAVQGENAQLRTHVAEMKAQMNFQTRKMEDMTRQAQDEKARFVSMIEDTRHRFHEWKEGEAEALAAAHDQAVRKLKTEYELKMERHQDEKQKLRDKVNDLEVSIRLLQKDRALSPLELSLRKTAILGSDNTGAIEAEQIETQSRILELENLLAHSQQYQARQEGIIKLSEATISRLMQEREVTALENLSLHPFGVEPQRGDNVSYDTRLSGYVVAPSSPTRRSAPQETPTRSQQGPVKSTEPPIARSSRSRSHTPRRADLEASIAQAAQADNAKKQTANTEKTEPSSREKSLMDELAQLKKALVEAQAKAESNALNTEEVKGAEQEAVEMPVLDDASIGLAAEAREFQPIEADAPLLDTVEPSPVTDVVEESVGAHTESETPPELKAEVGVDEAPGAESKVSADNLDDTATDLIDNVSSEPHPTEVTSCQNTSEQDQPNNVVEPKELLEKCKKGQSELDGIVTTTSDEQEILVQEGSPDVNEWVDVSAMSDEQDSQETEPQQDCCSNLDIEESKTGPNEAKNTGNNAPFDPEGITELAPSYSQDRGNESTCASDDEIIQSHDEKYVKADLASELKSSCDLEPERDSDSKADGKEVTPLAEDDAKLLEDVGDTNSDEKEEPREITEPHIENLEANFDEKVTTSLVAEDAKCPGDLDSKAQDTSNVEDEEKYGVKGSTDEVVDFKEKEHTAAVVDDFMLSVGCAEQEEVVEIPSAVDEADIVEANDVVHNEEPPETEGDALCPAVEERTEGDALCPAVEERAEARSSTDAEETESPVFIVDVSAENLRVDDASECINAGEAFVPEVKEAVVLDEADTVPEISIDCVETELKLTGSPLDNDAVGIAGTKAPVDLQDTRASNTSIGETEVEDDRPINTKTTDDEAVIEVPLNEDEIKTQTSLEADVSLMQSEETHEELAVKPQLQEEEPSVSSCGTAIAPHTDTENETPEASTAKVFVALVELTGLSVVASHVPTNNAVSLLDGAEDPSPPGANVIEVDVISAKVDDILVEPEETEADVVSDSMNELPLPADNVVVGDDSSLADAPVVSAIIEAEVDGTSERDAILTCEVDVVNVDVTDVSSAGNDDIHGEEQQLLEGNSSSAPMEVAVETNEDEVALLTKSFAERFVNELMEIQDPTASYRQNQEVNETLRDENVSSVPDTVDLPAAHDAPAEEPTVESVVLPSGSADEVKDTLGVEAICSSFQSATEGHIENLPLDEITTGDTLTVARIFVSAVAFEAMSSVLQSLQTELCPDDTILIREQEGFESDSTRSIIESGYVSSDEQNDPEILMSEPGEQGNTEEETNTSTSLTEDSSEELSIVGGDGSEAALVIARVVDDCVESVEREVITTLSENGGNNDEAMIALDDFSTTELITDVSCVFTSHAIAEALHRLTDCAKDESSSSNLAADNGNLGVGCEADIELGEFLPIGEIGSEASVVGSSEEVTVVPEVTDVQVPEECDDIGETPKEVQMPIENVDEKLEPEVVLAVYDITEGVALGQTEAEQKGGIIESLVSAEVSDVNSKSATAANVEIEDLLCLEDGVAVETTDLQIGDDVGVIAFVLAEIIERIMVSESNQDGVCDAPISEIIPAPDTRAPSPPAQGENADPEMPIPIAACDQSETSDTISSDDFVGLVVEGLVAAIESCKCVESESGFNDSNASGEKEGSNEASEESTTSDSLSASIKNESTDPATKAREVPTVEDEASEDLGTTDTKMEDPNKQGDIEAYAVRSFGLPLTDVEHLVRLTLDSLIDAVAGHSVNEPSRRPSVPDEFEVDNTVSNLCVSAGRNIGPKHGRARSVRFSSDMMDEKSDRLKQERRSVLLWKSPVDTASNKESVESSAKRRASRRRVSRRTLADLLTFPNEMSKFSSSDTTLLAYDARQEQGPIFSLMDQSILTINPNGQHIDLDDSDERVVSKIIGKRKTLMQELHSKNLALRQIPRFNYMPMSIKFQWSDFVVATPVRPTNTNIGEGHVDKSPVEPMRLLQKRGAKLPCGTYVVVSAFIRPLEDGNENLRVQIYDGERVEEFQFDFSEDFMNKYHLETNGLEAQSLEFLGHLEFRRDEDTIIIKLPERKAGEGDKTDVNRIQSERTMVGGGDPRRREPASKHSKMRHSRPASSPTMRETEPHPIYPAEMETTSVEESELVHM